ncbi:MAG: hypothetical protein WBG19_07385 [Thermoplasmata archaeon]
MIATGEVFPGAFDKPTSIFISGASRSLLKWFAVASLAPYSSRVYWTDVRLPGEILEPLDPMALHAVPEETVYVLHPRELQPDDEGAHRAEAAAATMLRSDGAPGSIEGLVEFLRMPAHAQKLISSTGRPEAPSILVTANSQRLASVYSPERIAPLMRAMLESGTCQVALWAEAPTTYVSIFDVLLHLDGDDPSDWRNATVRCDRGLSAGPLAGGTTLRLSEIESISRVLEKSIPPIRTRGG